MAWMLSGNLQRWLKGLHLTLAGLCLGGTGGLLAVQYMKYCCGDDIDHLTAEFALRSVWVWGVAAPFYGLLLTGLFYSLFTDRGFLRYRWVTVKWLAALGLVVLNWIWLGTAVGGMVSLADGNFTVEGALLLYKELFRQATGAAVIQVLILVVIVFLSVFKPWGQRERESRVSVGLVRVIALSVVLAVAGLLTAGTVSLKRYRAMEIADVSAQSLADGIYRGEATMGSFLYAVDVTISGGYIRSVDAVKNRGGLYPRLAEGVFERVLINQTANVDAITGATTTSKALLKAVEDALVAGGERETGNR